MHGQQNIKISCIFLNRELNIIEPIPERLVRQQDDWSALKAISKYIAWKRMLRGRWKEILRDKIAL